VGTRVIYAICNDCERRKCPKCKKDDYMFPIVIEWMTKEQLIEHLKKTRCPCCGSDNWTTTDYSEV